MSLADEILDYPDLEECEISVPQWGGKKLLLRQLDALEFDKALKILTGGTEQEKDEFAARLLVQSCYDPATKERIFTDAHIARLMKKNPHALAFIGLELRKLNWADQSEEEVRKN
jgi:hypothetical protein